MTEKIQFDFKDEYITLNGGVFATARTKLDAELISKVINELLGENEQLKKELERCKEWINSDKYDYELTLAFIKSKGYSLQDVLEYEKLKR